MNVNKLQEAAKEKNLLIKDLKITDIIPNVIEDVILNITEENKCEIYLPKNMNGFEYKKWRNNRGGMFYTDCIKYTKNKNHGHYVFLQNKEEKIIARLIDEDELPLFKTLNLIDGKIKDKSYMLLKSVKDENCLKQNDRYIDQIIEEQEILKIIIPNIYSNPEDSEISHKDSISLFD